MVEIVFTNNILTLNKTVENKIQNMATIDVFSAHNDLIECCLIVSVWVSECLYVRLWVWTCECACGFVSGIVCVLVWVCDGYIISVSMSLSASVIMSANMCMW